MHKYELTVIARTGTDTHELGRIMKDYGKPHIKKEGNKRLAYSIANQEFGDYYYVKFEMEETREKELQSKLDNADWSLRYLLVRTYN